MAKKVLKKAQDGSLLPNYTKKTTTKTQDGNYKIKMNQEIGDDKITTTGKVRRTLKGFLSGAPRPDKEKKNYSSETTYKSGGMIKRADGSYSKRGLWDNIRANKGSGKKPTAAMLKQEKKIKAQTKKK
jgi:hypothetical protein